MHKIRQSARRQAWYHDFEDDGPRTYNFFGRINTRPRLRPLAPDPEALLPHGGASSATDLTISLHPSGGDEFHGVRRAATFPSSGREERFDAAHATGEFSKTTGSSIALPENDKVSFSAAYPRKRKFHLPFTGLKDEDGKTIQYRLTITGQARAILLAWTNLLLVFIPVGFALNYTHHNPVAVFVINFIAIIPSNGIIAFACDELHLYIDTIEALLSISFGNVAQLISSILLLKTGQIAVLRSSLLGTILQNLLVMTGLSFLVGGYGRKEQHYNSKKARTIGMFLLLAVLSLLVPTVSQLWGHSSPSGIVAQSRGTAVVIIFSYGLYLLFQLKTDRELFQEESEKVPRFPDRKLKGETVRSLAMIGAASGAAVGGKINIGQEQQQRIRQREEEIEKIPQLTSLTALITLIVFTTLLAFNVQFATDSIQGIIAQHHVSDEFIGIVVLPILSNDPVSLTAAWNDQMDDSISLTLERCMQAALMVVPLIVLIAWGMGIDEMTLDFDGFSVAALFASIVIVTYVVQEGRSNWLTGALLLKVFIIIGLASFYIN